MRSNALNLLLSQSQIKVWMIECLAYACQAIRKDSGCVYRKVSIIVIRKANLGDGKSLGEP